MARPPKWRVDGPLSVLADCPRCRCSTSHERYFSTVWCEVMRRCLTCGREEIEAGGYYRRPEPA